MNTSSRNGKIARLSFDLRTELNSRLQNGQPGPKLTVWLNSLPEVQQLLSAEFEGRPISEQNLSEWRNGGYRDWLSEVEAAAHAAEQTAQTVQIAKAGVTTDQLFTHLVALYAVALSHWDGSESSPSFSRIQALKPLTREILALRKSEHNALRLSLERDKLEFKRSSTRQESSASQSPSVSAPAATPSPAATAPCAERAESSLATSYSPIAADIAAHGGAKPITATRDSFYSPSKNVRVGQPTPLSGSIHAAR